MTDEPRGTQPRSARLRAYLLHNRERMLVDGIVLGTWVFAAWTVSGRIGIPAWLFYLVLFIGVIVYSRVTVPWSRPYRSPDLAPISEELEQREDERDQPE